MGVKKRKKKAEKKPIDRYRLLANRIESMEKSVGQAVYAVEGLYSVINKATDINQTLKDTLRQQQVNHERNVAWMLESAIRMEKSIGGLPQARKNDRSS